MGSRRHFFLSIVVLILGFVVGISGIAAQGVSPSGVMTIELSAQTGATLQGVLVVPEGNLFQFLRAERQEKATPDGSASARRATAVGSNAGTWTIKSFNPGRYSFYISDVFSDDDSPGTLQWNDRLASIRITVPGQGTKEIKPRLDASGRGALGRVWHAFDIDGSTGEVSEVNAVFPFRRMVYGIVNDAVTGQGVPGVKVSLLNSTGRVVDEIETDQSGIYTVFPPSLGTWKLSFVKRDIINVERTVQYLLVEAPQRFDISLSQRLAATQIRVVLSWGKYPQDLDLHVGGPGVRAGEFVRLSYQNMREYQGQYFLDRDDKDGNGPETVTLNHPGKGLFTISVHDFTNKSNMNSGSLAGSGASLTVYKGAEVLATVSVPSGTGVWWHALTFDETGALRMLNRLDNQAPSP